LSLSIYLDSEAATEAFAIDLAMSLKIGDFIALKGDLGAGKSTLARALIRTLMRDDALEVPSPTFSLVQHYQSDNFDIAHGDLYRLVDAQEIDELGLVETLDQGILLVEWPDRAGDLLPPPSFVLELDYAPIGRQITVEMTDEARLRFGRSREIRAFLEEMGKGQVHRYYLAGDASSRRYETIVVPEDGETYILMDGARMHPVPENTNHDYAQMVNLAQDVRQFVGMARLIKDKGFAAPQILKGNLPRGLLLLEDLGREGIVDVRGKAIEARYLAAAALLADIHAQHWPRKASWPDMRLTIPNYDAPTLYREVVLLLDWYLPYQAGIEVTDPMRQLYAEIWDGLISRLQEAEQGLCLRDYHSPNIIWREQQAGHDRLGLIDFQDALIGPVAYDVASLAQDARTTISSDLEAVIIDTYCDRRAQHDPFFDAANLRYIYAVAATQRVAKILGLFVRLERRDGKPDYLAHLPRLVDYLRKNLCHPDLKRLHDFCLTYKILGAEID